MTMPINVARYLDADRRYQRARRERDKTIRRAVMRRLWDDLTEDERAEVNRLWREVS